VIDDVPIFTTTITPDLRSDSQSVRYGARFD